MPFTRALLTCLALSTATALVLGQPVAADPMAPPPAGVPELNPTGTPPATAAHLALRVSGPNGPINRGATSVLNATVINRGNHPAQPGARIGVRLPESIACNDVQVSGGAQLVQCNDHTTPLGADPLVSGGIAILTIPNPIAAHNPRGTTDEVAFTLRVRTAVTHMPRTQYRFDLGVLGYQYQLPGSAEPITVIPQFNQLCKPTTTDHAGCAVAVANVLGAASGQRMTRAHLGTTLMSQPVADEADKAANQTAVLEVHNLRMVVTALDDPANINGPKKTQIAPGEPVTVRIQTRPPRTDTGRTIDLIGSTVPGHTSLEIIYDGVDTTAVQHQPGHATALLEQVKTAYRSNYRDFVDVDAITGALTGPQQYTFTVPFTKMPAGQRQVKLDGLFSATPTQPLSVQAIFRFKAVELVHRDYPDGVDRLNRAPVTPVTQRISARTTLPLTTGATPDPGSPGAGGGALDAHDSTEERDPVPAPPPAPEPPPALEPPVPVVPEPPAVPEPSVPEPSVPEPSVPEPPVVPEPSVPEPPVVPEPSVPEPPASEPLPPAPTVPEPTPDAPNTEEPGMATPQPGDDAPSPVEPSPAEPGPVAPAPVDPNPPATSTELPVPPAPVAGDKRRPSTILTPPPVSAEPAPVVAYQPAQANRGELRAVQWIASTIPPGEPVDTVIISRDDLFADSLSSGGLQGILNAPLLLNPAGELSDLNRETLQRLNPRRVMILGGKAAISLQTEAQINALGFPTQRLFGKSRVETAIAVAQAFAPDATTAVLARAYAADGSSGSQAFADTLAGGALAARHESPVLLTTSDTLPDRLREYLAHSKIRHLTLLGAEQAISQTIVRELQGMGITITRLDGNNRAHTAVTIAQSMGYWHGGESPSVLVVNGEDERAWTDAFPAALYAKRYATPVLLTTSHTLMPESIAWMGPGLSQHPKTQVICGYSVGPVPECTYSPGRPKA